MASYCWDLGFNWNAALNPGSTNEYYLQPGFVGFSGTTSAFPDTAVNLQTGDTMSFYVYNTTPAATSGDFSVVSAAVTMYSAVPNQNTGTPFVSGTISASPSSTVWSSCYSQIFENNLPVWTGLAQQTIESKGAFLFNASVTIQSGTSQKTFVVDPEMIVGSTG